MLHEHQLAIWVFSGLFVVVSLAGFFAARTQSASTQSPADMHEWSLGGRTFGTLLSWFLIGGDLYTAYTFIAIPALVFGAGAFGFYGVPYTIIIYPLIFAIMPRLWHICSRENYVTAADFVRGHFSNRSLALAVAVSGIVATMPYIALQLVGMQVVISALGFPMTGFFSRAPLIIAFATVAAYTYISGIRAPAFIAIAKDILIYVTIIAAIAVIPTHLGGFAAIFAQVPPAKLLLPATSATSAQPQLAYASLALGSAVALMFYPHSLTAILSAKNTASIRRNAMLLPAYSLLLGFLSLLGFMAYAAKVDQNPQFAPFFAVYHTSFAVPALFLQYFPEWFVGVAFAAIAIGALVPASIMAIAAANLFARNIYAEFFAPADGSTNLTQVARVTSLIILAGALAFMLYVPMTYAVQWQMLGGVWILQSAPIVTAGLFMPFFRARSLLAGWCCGMLYGTSVAFNHGFAPIVDITLGSQTYSLYIAVAALAIHLSVAAVGSAFERRAAAPVQRAS